MATYSSLKMTPSFENGKQAIAQLPGESGYATTEVIPLKSVPGISEIHYLYYFLLHPEVRTDLAGKMDGSTGRQRLSKEALGSTQIPLPPLTEQEAIASFLGLVQRACELNDDLLTRDVGTQGGSQAQLHERVARREHS